MARELPVVVMSGGLGSGKTTVLNHLLRTTPGRLGVVVNDFGAVNVDALLVSGYVDATVSFSGGCLCCLADPADLDRALASLARPQADLDAVVIEASGLAEPRTLARMVLASAVPEVRFGGLVELVDPTARELPAPDHLDVATLLVVTKADLVGPEELERVGSALRAAAPRTPVVRVAHGHLDPRLLLDWRDRPEPVGQLSLTDLLAEEARRETSGEAGSDGDRPAHRHTHDHHASVSVEADAALDPAGLVRWLEERDPALYRVKGLVRVEAEDPARSGCWVVQAVGRWLSAEQRPWPAGDPRTTRLVVIGTSVDEEAVRRELGALATGMPAGRAAMVPLLALARRGEDPSWAGQQWEFEAALARGETDEDPEL